MKHIYHIFFVITLACIVPQTLLAQNDIQQTNYMFNELSYNPAYAGATGTIRATLLGRKQWVGFDGSPFTQTLAFDAATKRLGSWGFLAINDVLGFQRFVHAKALYSYSVHFSEKTTWTAGLGGGIIYSSLDGTSLEYQNKEIPDPEGIFDMQRDIRPTFDAGMQFLHNNLSLGLSITHVQQSLRSATLADNPQHFYFYGQYKWNLNTNLYAVPTIWVKHGSNKTQADANMNFYINQRFWLGATYRINEAAAFLAGIILKEQWYIGYSYDFPISDLTGYNWGSHEIFISFRLKPAAPQSGFYQSTRLFN